MSVFFFNLKDDVIRVNNESTICVLMIYVHDHMTNTKSHTVGTSHTVRNISKIQSKNVERGEIRSPSTQIHDRSLSWLGADTSIQSGGVELDLWAQTLELWNAISIKHQIICTPNTVIFLVFILFYVLISSVL